MPPSTLMSVPSLSSESPAYGTHLALTSSARIDGFGSSSSLAAISPATLSSSE